MSKRRLSTVLVIAIRALQMLKPDFFANLKIPNHGVFHKYIANIAIHLWGSAVARTCRFWVVQINNILTIFANVLFLLVTIQFESE